MVSRPMKRMLSLALLLLAAPVLAQDANPGLMELRSRVTGYASQLPPKGNTPNAAQAKGNPNFTPARLEMMRRFADWIRASYPEPVGAVVEPWFSIYPEKANPRFYMPVSWTTSLRYWTPAYADASHSLSRLKRAQPAASQDISIAANTIPGMEGLGWFDTPTALYVTMAVDTAGNPVDADAARFNAARAEVQRIAGGRLTYVAGAYVHVMLGVDRIPVTPLTRGQALDVAEAGCRRAHEKGDNTDAQLQAQLGVIARTRAKYRGSLDAPASLNAPQFGLDVFSGTGDADYDPFGPGHKGARWPVYTIAPEVYSATRSAKPQWITISFPVGTADAVSATALSGPSARAIWKAMTTRFNFDDVDNLVFHPERMQGRGYTPRPAE